MCVLSIKVPIRKKSGNLFNDPRNNYLGLLITISVFFTIKQCEPSKDLKVKREIEEKQKGLIFQCSSKLVFETQKYFKVKREREENRKRSDISSGSVMIIKIKVFSLNKNKNGINFYWNKNKELTFITITPPKKNKERINNRNFKKFSFYLFFY